MRAGHACQRQDRDVAEDQHHRARAFGQIARRWLWFSLLLAAAATFGTGWPAHAQDCAQPVGTVQSLEGEVSIGDAGGAWHPAQLGAPLCQTDSVRTGSLSRAALVLINDEVLRLDQDSTLKLEDVPLDAAQPTVLDLAFGAVQSFSRSPKKVNVNTSFMTLAIRGTEFEIRADDAQSRLTVLEGEVVASNAQGEVPVPSGSQAVARAGEAPQVSLVARPRDAVAVVALLPADLLGPTRREPRVEGGPAPCRRQRHRRCAGRARQGAGRAGGRHLPRRPPAPGRPGRRGQGSARRRFGRRSAGRAGARPALDHPGGPERARRGAGRRPEGGRARPDLGRRQDRPVLRAAGPFRHRRRPRRPCCRRSRSSRTMRWPGRGCRSCG